MFGLSKYKAKTLSNEPGGNERNDDMGIEKVTTHPLKYQYMEMIDELIDAQYPNGLPYRCDRGRFCLRFELMNAHDQRHTAQIIATAVSGKAEYHRDREWRSIYNKGYYEAAG